MFNMDEQKTKDYIQRLEKNCMVLKAELKAARRESLMWKTKYISLCEETIVDEETIIEEEVQEEMGSFTILKTEDFLQTDPQTEQSTDLPHAEQSTSSSPSPPVMQLALRRSREENIALGLPVNTAIKYCPICRITFKSGFKYREHAQAQHMHLIEPQTIIDRPKVAVKRKIWHSHMDEPKD